MIRDLIKHNKQVYNKITPFFSATRQYLWDDLKPLAKYIKDGDKVLDLGCGNGRLCQLFSGLSIDYIGVDQSEELIKVATRENNPELKFKVGEMTKLDFEDDSFDIIYCIAAFHHLPDETSRLKSLEEMKRVLKNDGTVVMTNWNLNSKSARWKVESGKWKVELGTSNFMIPWMTSEGEILGKRYYHGFTLDELEHLFKKIGFVLEDQYYTKKGARGGVDDPGNIVSILHSCN